MIDGIQATEAEVGDYVLATKYADGDPCDHFFVGFVDGYTWHHRYMIVDNDGNNQRGNGFRRVEKLTEEEGRQLVEMKKGLNMKTDVNRNSATPPCYAIEHGSRVLVYDYTDFINDRATPCDMLMRPATVVCRYGKVTDYGSGPCQYPDLVDVVFDHRPERVSHGHFTDRVELIALFTCLRG